MNHGRNAITLKCNLDKKMRDKPLVITNCGFYSAHNQKVFYKEHVDPRDPYATLLIYQHKGSVEVIHETEKTIVDEGSIILFSPTIRLRHLCYQPDETNERYYIYLSGQYTVEYLKQFGFSKDLNIVHIGKSETLVQYFLDMLNDFELHDFSTDIFRIRLFFNIFAHIHKKMQRTIPNRHIHIRPEILASIDYMNQNYHTNISLEDSARVATMSSSNFLRLFKQQMGLSPHQYLTNLRLTNAEYLLSSSDLSVSEIAQQVGFIDPLYFSKAFKKFSGKSPLEYRKYYEI